MARKLKAKLELDTLTANRHVKKVGQSLRDVGKQGKKAGDEIGSGIDKGTGSAARFVKTFVGVGAAVGAIAMIARQLREEYQHLVQQQRQAAQTQVSVGHARAAALYNRPDGMTVEYLDKLVTDVAQRQKVGQSTLWNTAGTMLSSKGPLSQQQFATAFEQTARMKAVGGPSINASVLGGGLQDIMKSTGLQDPRKAGGWMMQVGVQAHIAELGQQYRNIVPVIAAAKPFDFTAEQSAELFAYLTQQSGDVRGEQSRTGAISFMEILAGARTKGKSILPGGKRLKGRGIAGLKELQDWWAGASQSDRDIFASGLQVEKSMKGPLLNLIARESGAMADWQAARAGILEPTAPGTTAVWESYFTGVGRGKGEATRTAKRTFSTFVEAQELANPEAYASAVREGLGKSLRAIPGISDIAIKMAMMEFELDSNFGRGDVKKAAIERIRAVQKKYHYGLPYSQIGASGRWDFRAALPPGASRVDKKWYGPTSGLPGDEIWREDIPGPDRFYGPNPDYDPERAKAIQNLIEDIEQMNPGEPGPAQSMAPSINIGTFYGNTQRGFAVNDFSRMLA